MGLCSSKIESIRDDEHGTRRRGEDEDEKTKETVAKNGNDTDSMERRRRNENEEEKTIPYLGTTSSVGWSEDRNGPMSSLREPSIERSNSNRSLHRRNTQNSSCSDNTEGFIEAEPSDYVPFNTPSNPRMRKRPPVLKVTDAAYSSATKGQLRRMKSVTFGETRGRKPTMLKRNASVCVL